MPKFFLISKNIQWMQNNPGLISSNLIGVKFSSIYSAKRWIALFPTMLMSPKSKTPKRSFSQTLNIEFHYLDAQNVAIKTFFQKK